MKNISFVCCLLLGSCIAFAQDSTLRTHGDGDSSTIITAKNNTQVSETMLPLKTRIKRTQLVAAGNIIGYGGSMVGLYFTWYADYPQSRFHFFNDNNEWLQVDKAGHTYSAYIESRASMEMWRWAGLSRKKRIWIGGMSGAVYQTVIETLDGFSQAWGWSWGDFTSNIVGSGLLVSQELIWDEQRISMKFSTHRKQYDDPDLAERAGQLYGTRFSETFLKDYNAQTIWLSANIKSFFRQSRFPAWLNMAMGYGAEGMFGAADNRWTDENGSLHDHTVIPRYRQFYLAPDIDFTRIKTRSKALKLTFFVLNAFKFPAPSLEWSKGRLSSHWLHF